MAIPVTQPDERPTNPLITTKQKFKFIYEDKVQQFNTIIQAYAAGMPWVVDYYKQLLTTDSGNDAFAQNAPQVLQQYQLIRQLTIKVTEALSHSFQEKEGEWRTTGGAIIEGAIKPIVGDTFIADIGDGRYGRMQVKSARPMSILKETAYQVEYDLVEFVTDEIRKSMMDRVVRDTTYQSLQLQGSSLVMVESTEYFTITELRESLSILQQRYFYRCVDRIMNAITIPDQPFRTYDAFLMAAIEKIFPPDTRPHQFQYLYVVNTVSEPMFREDNFWDVLLYRENLEILSYFKEVTTLDARVFASFPSHSQLAYSPMQRYVYPKGKGRSTGWRYGNRISSSIDMMYPFMNSTDIGDLIQNPLLNGLYSSEEQVRDKIPLIKTVGFDDYYVLSQAFYEQDYLNMSQMELQVWKMLKNEPVDVQVLKMLLDASEKWSPANTVWNIPVLIILIEYFLRSCS